MKQLFINAQASTLFFESNVSIHDICKWINERIILDDNFLNLNENYSCSAFVSSKTTIMISGDEDLKQIIIEEITPIKL